MSATAFSISNRKIDPTRRANHALKPDGTPNDNDRVEIGPTARAFAEWAALGITPPDLPKLREYRLERIRGELRRRGYAGVLLFDPLNIRYATDSMNMQVWTMHNFARACFIATDGPVILWDFARCDHLTEHLPLISEVRYGAGFFYFLSGERTGDHAKAFAAEVAELMRLHGGGERRLAVDKMEIDGYPALQAHGIELCAGQPVTELARVIKDANEVNAMRCAVAACEAACEEMRATLRPGVAEAELWAALHHGNIARGGEWIETRILSSGPRTNPWFQECGPRVIQAGELVGFDTDLVGPYGYCCDISRTWFVDPGEPTAEQRRIYRIGYDHIMENMELLRPGVSFRDLVYGGAQLPEEFVQQQYAVRFHGVGLCDEYPSIMPKEAYEEGSFPEEYGYLQPGMTICVEVYVGAVGGAEGVKLEDQVLITETGHEVLSTLPYEERLLA